MSGNEPTLTGQEPWVIAANAGHQLFATKWGKEFWWPIHDIELDCGLIRIDVCGLLEILDLGDVAKIKWEGGAVDQDDFYEAGDPTQPPFDDSLPFMGE